MGDLEDRAIMLEDKKLNSRTTKGLGLFFRQIFFPERGNSVIISFSFADTDLNVLSEYCTKKPVSKRPS